MAESTSNDQPRLPEFDDEEPGDEELESQSGLGKGLAAIIPRLAGLDDESTGPEGVGGLASLIPGLGDDGAGEEPAGSEGESPAAEAAEPGRSTAPGSRATGPAAEAGGERRAVRQLRDDLICALLEGLTKTIRLDLCAYVHRQGEAESELFLAAPDPAGVGAGRLWELFGALRTAIDRERSDPAFDAAGLRGLVMATGGSGSAGVFALARGDGLTDPEQAVAERFCTSFGRAVHQLEGEPMVSTEPDGTSVEVHAARDSVLARVGVAVGGEVRPGTGRAGTRVEAVTRAVIDALGADASFRYASEVAHDGHHAAVALVESSRGAVSLGSAVCDGAAGLATALAAVRAVSGLDASAEVAQPT